MEEIWNTGNNMLNSQERQLHRRSFTVESSAGLLMTANARRVVRWTLMARSLDPAQRAELAEATRKRHKSAGDHLKRRSQVCL